MNYFNNFADFFASTLPASGAGSIWQVAGGYSYQEADSATTDFDVTNAAGVKFHVEAGPYGSPQDIQFGLFDDPVLAMDQTAAFEKFIAKGGTLLVTAGNTYKLSTADQVETASATSIRPTAEGELCKLVGSTGNRLFKPLHSLSIAGLEATGFEAVCSMISSVDIPLFEIRDCYVHDQDYLYRGAVQCDDLIIEDNVFERFSAGLVFEDGSSIVRNRQSFSRNRINDVARYVYRLSADAPLWFKDNHITDVHSGTFTGTAGVVRFIQRGSRKTNIVTGNTCLGAVASTANCVFMYWSHGDLVFSNNTIGGFESDASSCYVIQEKSSGEKSLVMHDNNFVNDPKPSKVNQLIYLLTSRENQQRPRSIQGNCIETLQGRFLSVYDNDSLTDTVDFTGDNLDSEPCSITVQNNIIYNLQSSSFVGVTQGVWGLSVLNNQCWNHSNPDGLIQGGTTEATKSIISLASTVPNATMKNVVCSGNNWRFTNMDESPETISAISFVTALKPESETELVVQSNTVSGADHLHSHRNKQGAFNLALKDNTLLGGIAGTEIEGASVGDGITELLNSRNDVLG
ncbi:hypothetical protein [Sphingorhabdus sp. Alg239-R122]|uniref:hypothetical protein n=1 Tax=Sphingorhabdus sp. Alg239-R122 TaxID=2305989 RepID=UPI0013DB974E|nr:hypothetical protein [Sphingorhabdus sp. Alg239-R122]